MSQQGPGGYGGGFGPPGGPGVPPGGMPGAPPGGMPGAPPGWGPAPPPGYPQYGAPGGAPPPKKKTNPLVWVGVGCGVLFLLAAGTGVAVFLIARNAARSGAAGAFSAAVELALDGGVMTFDAGVTTGAPSGTAVHGGPTCERAADCCRRVLEKTGANPQTLAACEGLRQATELACQQALEVHRRSAPLLGTSCPEP